MIKITKGYKKSDFDSLLRINDLCYSGDERPPRETFAQMLELSEVWVMNETRAVENKCGVETTPVGFIIVNERLLSSDPNVAAYLWSMAVHPDYRGQGVGGRMLQLVCMQYTGRAIELHCRVDNPVQKMYFDYGFRVVEVARKHYFMDGKYVNGLKMRRDIAK